MQSICFSVSPPLCLFTLRIGIGAALFIIIPCLSELFLCPYYNVRYLFYLIVILFCRSLFFMCNSIRCVKYVFDRNVWHAWVLREWVSEIWMNEWMNEWMQGRVRAWERNCQCVAEWERKRQKCDLQVTKCEWLCIYIHGFCSLRHTHSKRVSAAEQRAEQASGELKRKLMVRKCVCVCIKY